jgi:hypothetical protein
LTGPKPFRLWVPEPRSCGVASRSVRGFGEQGEHVQNDLAVDWSTRMSKANGFVLLFRQSWRPTSPPRLKAASVRLTGVLANACHRRSVRAQRDVTPQHGTTALGHLEPSFCKSFPGAGEPTRPL